VTRPRTLSLLPHPAQIRRAGKRWDPYASGVAEHATRSYVVGRRIPCAAQGNVARYLADVGPGTDITLTSHVAHELWNENTACLAVDQIDVP
jgi:hypothetical protein